MARGKSMSRFSYVLNTALRLVLAIALLLSGLLHLQNVPNHLVSLTNYAILGEILSRFLAYVIPVLHLYLGCSFLLGLFVFESAVAAFLLFSSFTMAQVLVLDSGRQISCGCFGASHLELVSWGTVLRVAFLALLALYLAYRFQVAVHCSSEANAS
jgi:uncharacterized membrane protein YphA (DoxX/SURF4 family)